MKLVSGALEEELIAQWDEGYEECIEKIEDHFALSKEEIQLIEDALIYHMISPENGWEVDAAKSLAERFKINPYKGV